MEVNLRRLFFAVALACLAPACPAAAHDASPNPGQAKRAEWEVLLDRASQLSDVEARKPEAQRNYKAILAIMEQAERSVTGQFASGSSPHMQVLHTYARYLGLSGAYDRQLQVARRMLEVTTAKEDASTLGVAMYHIGFTTALTSDYDGHKEAGAQALREAADILTALGPIGSADMANIWQLYAQQMVKFGGASSDRIKILTDIINFRKSEDPRNINQLTSAFWMLAETYNSLNTSNSQYSAMTTYRDAMIAAEADLRPENTRIGMAQFKYGDHLLAMGRTVEAELYLEAAIKTLTTPGPGADPDWAEAAKASLAAARNGPVVSSEVVQTKKPDEEYNGWRVKPAESFCSIWKEFDRGIIMLIDYDDRKNRVTLLINDPSFHSIKDNEEYKLDMDVPLKGGGAALYGKVSFQGKIFDGFRAIMATFLGREFLGVIEKASRVRVRRGDISVADIDVSAGSGLHVAALRRCAETRTKENPSDPFKN